jgi:Uma2 family endonuclease
MGETEVHIQCLIDTREALRAYFRDDPNVYVGANLLLYYERGQPFLVVSPDVFVTRGIPKLPQRRAYKLWEEGRPPSFILEITSRGTRREDRVVKKALYESLGVREYFLFDPLGEYLKPPLQGYELVRGRYRRKAATETGASSAGSSGWSFVRKGRGSASTIR